MLFFILTRAAFQPVIKEQKPDSDRLISHQGLVLNFAWTEVIVLERENRTLVHWKKSFRISTSLKNLPDVEFCFVLFWLEA